MDSETKISDLRVKKPPEEEAVQEEGKKEGVKKAKKPGKGPVWWVKFKSIKHYELIIAAVIIAILLLVYVGVSSASANTSVVSATPAEDTYVKTIEQVLSEINGVGKVKVMITYKGGTTTEIAYKTDKETTSTNENGYVSSSTTETSSPVLVNNGGKSEPIVLKEIMPEIEGVVIVAQGGADAKIQYSIVKAIQTALGIDAAKIQVFQMK